MRYNPPPNWPPAPAGWTPPPGWQPDPSWPPPPPGWPLWVPDQRRRTALIVGGVIAVALIALIATVLVVTTGSKPASDEEQIRAVINRSYSAWQRGDADAYGKTICAAKRADEVEHLKNDDHRDEGELSVGKVTVHGDHAEAEVTMTEDGDTDTDEMDLVREDGDWLMC